MAILGFHNRVSLFLSLIEHWYGNIEPTEYDTSSCKEYKKLLELICRNEEKL